MGDEYVVTVAAGTLRSGVRHQITMAHRWTDDGVAIEVQFTGAHVLHLAVAACVLNDLYREAAARGVELRGVRVTARGGFDTETWRSTGITYRIETDPAPARDAVADVVALVDRIAEIPRALRASTDVTHER